MDVPTNTQPPAYYRPDKLVRTDAKSQTLHAFLGSAQPATQGNQRAAPASLPAGAEAQEQEQSPQAEEEKQDQGGAEVETMELGEQAEVPAGGVGAAAVAAHEAAAGLQAARRRRGGPARQTGSAFSYMPTPMEIAGAGDGAEAAGGAGEAGQQPGATQQQQQQAQLQRPVRQRQNPAAVSSLQSVQGLLVEAERAPHGGLAEILKSHTFVGLVDEVGRWGWAGLWWVAEAPCRWEVVAADVCVCRGSGWTVGSGVGPGAVELHGRRMCHEDSSLVALAPGRSERILPGHGFAIYI